MAGRKRKTKKGRKKRNVTEAERELTRKLYHNRKKKPSDIAGILGREKSRVTKNLFVRKEGAPGPGRPPALTKKQVDNLEARTEQLIEAADGKKEVSLKFVKRRTRCPAGTKTIARNLHKRGVRWHPLRNKPALTEEDQKARRAFARKWGGKPKNFWKKKVHMFIDNKNFPVYTNGAARAHAARRTVRGAYRKRGGGLGKGFVKVRKSLHQNTGAKSAIIAAQGWTGRNSCMCCWSSCGKNSIVFVH